MKLALLFILLFVIISAIAGDSTKVVSLSPDLAKAEFYTLSRTVLNNASTNTPRTLSDNSATRGGMILKSAGIGAAIGGGAGILAGLVTPKGEPFTRGDQVAILGITGAVTGALIGGLIGLLAKN